MISIRKAAGTSAFATIVFLCLAIPPSTADSLFSLPELEAALSREPTNKPLLMEVVRRYHSELLGDADIQTWEKAIKAFDLLNQAYKIYRVKRGGRVDPVAFAYYSSYQILRSAELGEKDSKLAQFYAGPVVFGQAVADLDFAHQLNPTDIEIRMVRGLNGWAYPGTNRLSKSVEDLRVVIMAVEKDPRRGKGINIPDIYIKAGTCAQRADDFLLAEGIWGRLVQLYPEAPEADEAQKLMAKYTEKARFQKKVELHILAKWGLRPGQRQQ